MPDDRRSNRRAPCSLSHHQRREDRHGHVVSCRLERDPYRQADADVTSARCRRGSTRRGRPRRGRPGRRPPGRSKAGFCGMVQDGVAVDDPGPGEIDDVIFDRVAARAHRSWRVTESPASAHRWATSRPSRAASQKAWLSSVTIGAGAPAHQARHGHGCRRRRRRFENDAFGGQCRRSPSASIRARGGSRGCVRHTWTGRVGSRTAPAKG